MAISKECPNCNASFKTYPSVDKKFCCKKCSFEFEKRSTYEKYKRQCKQCGKEFLPSRPKDGADYCSYKCRGYSDRKARVDRNGYWFVCKPEHPRASSQGYIGEHTLIMEKEIGRFLADDEVVHHVDHNRKNNDLDNLELMSISDHRRHHMEESIASGKIGTPEHRKMASIRMKENNPSVHSKRGSDGRYF